MLVIYEDDRIIVRINLAGTVKIRNKNNPKTEVSIHYVYPQGLSVQSETLMTPAGENQVYIHPYKIDDIYIEKE